MGETGEQHDRIDLDEAERLVEFEGIRRTRERNEGAAKEGTKSCFKSVAKKKKKKKRRLVLLIKGFRRGSPTCTD